MNVHNISSRELPQCSLIALFACRTSRAVAFANDLFSLSIMSIISLGLKATPRKCSQSTWEFSVVSRFEDSREHPVLAYISGPDPIRLQISNTGFRDDGYHF